MWDGWDTGVKEKKLKKERVQKMGHQKKRKFLKGFCK